MRELSPILAVDVALLAVVGVAVLVWLPATWRSRMLPAVLTLGVIGWVVALHLTGLVTGVRYGLWVILGCAIASIAVRSWRTRWWRTLDTKRYLAAALVLGAVPVLLALNPARSVGATVLQLSANNDAYEYVAVSQWLVDHPVLDIPPALSQPPAWGKVNLHLGSGLRAGEELYLAAVSEAVGRPPVDTWYVVTAGWLLLLPGSALAALDVLGIRRLVGLVAGGLAGVSTIAVQQVLNSNSDGAVGVTIAPLAVATVAVYIEHSRELPWRNDSDRPPVWLPAISTAALAGVYTEYLPLLVPAFGLFVLLRRPQRLPGAVLAALLVLGLAIVMAPLAWYRAASSFLVTSAITTGDLPSPYVGHVGTIIGRILGVVPLEQGVRLLDWRVLLLSAVSALGLALAVTLSPARKIFACVLLSFTAAIVILTSPWHYLPYGQYRAIGIGTPLAILMAVAGLAELVRRLARARLPRPALAGLVAALVAVGAVFIGVDGHTVNVNASYDVSHRQVDGAFDEMAAWAHRVGGPDGRDVSVLIPDHFDQVWSMYFLRDLSRANYPFLYSDYTNDPPQLFNDGRLRRFAVVGRGAFLDAAPGVVVGQNSRFLFLDLSLGSAVIALGVAYVSPVEPNGAGLRLWAFDNPTLLVAHTADVRDVRVTMAANPALGNEPLVATGAGVAPQRFDVGTTPGLHTLQLATGAGGRTVQAITLATQRPGVPPTAGDGRKLTVAILQVQR